MEQWKAQTRERMLRYAAIGTQSRPYEGVWPTTDCQRRLAEALYGELLALGCTDAYYDEAACVVYARIPSNLPAGAPDKPFGLIAHMDTAPDVPGAPVHPWALGCYDGGDVVLNEAEGIVMRRADYPELGKYVGQELVLTDGTTLLGGDDKAAIAAMMTFAEYLLTNPQHPHGTVCLAFTPDEEVGGLAHALDLDRFGAKLAYTIDGSGLGEYQDQTFYAAQAALQIRGRSVHPGTAKGIMVNAADILGDFLAMLPPRERPQYTEGTEGFYYVIDCAADCERASLRLIVRDFDLEKFEAKKAYLQSCAERLNETYGAGRVQLRLHEEYRNMGEILKDHPELTAKLRRAIADCGLTPVCEPFRGGTDGAALSFRGLPCPNLSAGYENAHGRFEYVPVQSMAKNVEILLRLTALFCEDTERGEGA